ncbi:hypothetical protein CTI12_AA218350 [Artemisia annua]|uniref:Zinc knuckle CX2CX4HX4C n=1 Tax=Artemisia annua TaxID=35608 RepID=A0A2U1MMD3_ARTAN|nr:hypothetical protein CTI12_AA218350 [Artemisia annua]
MDSITAKRCQFGEGKLDFARVLVEFEVSKGFKDRIEVQYRDKNNVTKGSKSVKVEYNWKPEICDHCIVFGHSFSNCYKRARTVEEIAEEEKKKEEMRKQGNEKSRFDQNRFTEVLNRRYRGRNQYMGGRSNGDNRSYEDKRNKEGFFKKKELNKGNMEEKGNEVKKRGWQYQKKGLELKSTDRYEMLNAIGSENDEIEILKGKMTVDNFLNKKIKPSEIDIKDWTPDMMKYFKEHEKLDKLKEAEDLKDSVEDVLEGTSDIAREVVANEVSDLNIAVWNIRSMNIQKKQKDVLNFVREEKLSVCGIVETHVKTASLSKVTDYAFGGWDWVSNSIHTFIVVMAVEF